MRELKGTLDKASYARLKGVMWPFRCHYWDLNEEQLVLLVRLFEHSPPLKQAWLLRHELFLIFESPYSPAQSDSCFKAWGEKVRASTLTCFDGFITLLDKHRTGISGFVEGLNNRLKVIKRRCFGLLDAGRLFQRIQINLQERTGFFSMTGDTTCCR